MSCTSFPSPDGPHSTQRDLQDTRNTSGNPFQAILIRMKRLAALLVSIFLTATILPATQARYSILADDGYVYATHPAENGFAVSIFDTETPSAPLRVRTIRSEGAPSTPLTMSGDVAYVGNGDRLLVIDLTCPERAAFIRSIRDGFHDQTVLGAHADGSSLVVEGAEETRLYDISDPFTPVLNDVLRARATSPLVANHRFTPLFVDGICRVYELTQKGFVGRGLAGIMPNSTCFFVSSSVLCETDRTSVRIYDFTVPGNPTIHPFTNSVMRPVASHPRGRLWVRHKDNLESWNVWRPLKPKFQKKIPFPFPDLLSNAFIYGDYCYVNDTERNALRVFSLANNKAVELCECPFPTGDKEEAPSSTPGAIRKAPLPRKADLVTDGSLLFATIGTKGNPKAIGVYDLSDPEKAVPVADVPLENPPCGLALYPGTNLLCAVDGFACHVFSFSANGTATRQASLPITEFEPYGPQDVTIDPRGFALLACRMDGVKSLNLTNLSELAVTDADMTGGFVRDITQADGYVYAASDTAGVTVHALSDDGALELFRTIPMPYGSAAGIAAVSNRVYATGQELPLALFTDTPHPQCVGLCETGQDDSFACDAEAIDVALVEKFAPAHTTTAFVLDRKRGLLVCDVTDLKNAKVLGTLPRKDFPGTPVAITSHGTSVYLLLDSGKVRRIDGTRAFPFPGKGDKPHAADLKKPENAPSARTDGPHEP